MRTDTKKSLPALRKPKDTELFTNELTDTQSIKLLKEAVKARKQAQYPNVPEYAITIPKYEDATANGLTKCIIDFLNSRDYCQAERINNQGVMRTNKYGQQFMATSSMTNGTADISATIYGRSVKIEVKIGNDKQSQNQIEYQNQIENAKGYYVIAKDFKGFLDWFNLKKGGQNGR